MNTRIFGHAVHSALRYGHGLTTVSSTAAGSRVRSEITSTNTTTATPATRNSRAWIMPDPFICREWAVPDPGTYRI